MSKQNNSNSGRKLNEVWNFFTKTPLKSAGHFSAKCIFCNRNWGRAYVKSLQAHLSNDCVECPNDIRNFYLGVLSTNDNMSVDDNLSSNSRMSIQSTNSFKRKKLDGQQGIEDFYEGKELTDSKKDAINTALVKAFVGCGISFNVINNPFFKELLHELRPNYSPPTRQTLSGNLLSKEIARVNSRIDKELEVGENLTLALDGWSSPGSFSIYNFIILTPQKNQYLYCLRDYSSSHHTGQFLAAEIKTASNILSKCSTIIKYFKKSHICQNLLMNEASYFSIQGGGLKTCIKTRWISIFESTNSIVRMRQALEEVVIKYPDEIKSRPVKKILKKQGFFEEVASLSQILLPIKNTIKILESDNSTLADVFIQMIRLAFKLKNINVGNMIELKRHSICAFNKRWDIGIKTGQYKLIVEAAREIWKSIDSSLKSEEILLSQMRKYKLKISPYDNDYVFLNETPKIWWLSKMLLNKI
ncbi:10234_t:CDS:2 [Entrophospora sp. SA101]|nr:10234_t:CDS:2 [Entrophospora sp. SA101]